MKGGGKGIQTRTQSLHGKEVNFLLIKKKKETDPNSGALVMSSQAWGLHPVIFIAVSPPSLTENTATGVVEEMPNGEASLGGVAPLSR